MTDKKKTKSKSKGASRRRTASNSSPDPQATMIKTNQAIPKGLDPRLGSASASVIRTQPRTYAPQYLDSSLSLPRDVRTQNAWNRTFFVTNPIVSSAIRLHAAYTSGKFKLVCKDRKIKEFFDDMLEKMGFQNTLLEVGLEYWKLGECCLPGTLVTMGDGTLKPIEEIKRGDEVLTHKGNIKKVTDLKTHQHCGSIYKIKCNDLQRCLAVTGNHPIWARDGDSREWKYQWIPAQDLKENDYGLTPRVGTGNYLYATPNDVGAVRKIQKIEQEYYEGWVFNLEVEDDHSYVAEGMAVHNCFPYAELDEEHGTWAYIVVHNPDFIHVPPPNPLQKDPIITLVPDEALKRIVTSTDPRDRALRNEIPHEVLLHIQKGEDIPLDNFNVSHLKMLSSPYDTRGTSLITSCYRDLLLYDKIREAKIIQADNFMNPLTLIKLGSENYKPTDDDIRQWQEQVLDSMGDQGYSIVTHALVDIQKISNAGQTLDMNPDLENAIKNIMVGLNVPQALFDQDYGSYASASVGLEVLKDRYRSFQLQLKKWIERKILEPIAKIQDFYVTEGGVEKLIVPTVEFDKINLKETDSFIGQIAGQLADPGTPGSGKISMRTFYDLLDTDYETERKQLKMEARDQIVLMKEIAGMQKMDLAQLKTLDENTPIQDPGEVESLEKSLDIEDTSSSAGGAAGGGGGDMGLGDLGGDMGGDMGLGGEEMPGGDLGGGEAPGGEAGGAPAPAAGGEPPA